MAKIIAKRTFWAVLALGFVLAFLPGQTVSYAQEQEVEQEDSGEGSFWDFLTRKTDTPPVPVRKPARAGQAQNMTLDLPVEDTLKSRDVDLYQKIFALIRDGEITKAREYMLDLSNGLLLGHARAQILLHPVHRARHPDLRAWLQNHADHPQAPQIYKLARARAPEGTSIKAPEISSNFPYGRLGHTKAGKAYVSKKKRSATQTQGIKNLTLQIRGLVRKTQPKKALSLLSESDLRKAMDQTEYDSLRALIASGYFYAGYNKKAKEIAESVLKKSARTVPMAGWIYGLSEWRDENYKEAARGFERAATSPYASGWMISAASYWAGRTHMRLRNHKKVSTWLERSAAYPRTFYGLVATRALGRDPVFDWEVPGYTRAHRKFISSHAQGLRARALVEIGEIGLAEAELKNISLGQKHKDIEAILAFASEYKLPALSYRIGNAVTAQDGGVYDGALYPVMSWKPEGGFQIDSALVHAFIRQESKFDSMAQSGSGATGLMQIMPATAKHLAGGKNFKSKADQFQLKDPAYNLKLGQAYLKELLAHPGVDGDLMALAIAYNAGPGNLTRWQRERIRIDEPLLFIETIPFSETRAFVERVLANFWIYRIRMGQENPTLEAVASGRWARFAQNMHDTKMAER